MNKYNKDQNMQIKSIKVVIIGGGGHAREILWLLREYNRLKKNNEPFYDVRGFLSNEPELEGTLLCDIPVLGSDDWLKNNQEVKAVCAIGNPRKRIEVIKKLDNMGVKFLTVIHPSVMMSEYVEIGEGVLICAGTIITTQVKIGDFVLINRSCNIGHDVIINDFCTIAPGVSISGNVEIGYSADLGTNAVVIQGCKIGQGAIIGAGAVVIKDIEENTVSVGVPAQVIKFVENPV